MPVFGFIGSLFAGGGAGAAAGGAASGAGAAAGGSAIGGGAAASGGISAGSAAGAGGIGAAGAIGGSGAGSGGAAAAGGGLLGGLGNFAGSDMGQQAISAGVPLLGDMLSPKHQIDYPVDPYYGDQYSYDPYSWAKGEKETYQGSLDEILRRQKRREAEQVRGYSEDINRRGLGASSIYATGRGRIAQTGQQALTSQNVARLNALQATREKRAGAQRLQKHQYNIGLAGPTRLAQAKARDKAGVARQGNLMGTIAQVAPMVTKGIGGGA